MSCLTWTRCDDGWRAGQYDIELFAPELWVCTRKSPGGRIEIVATGGSLNALKKRVALLEHRRSGLRRSLLYLSGLVASLMVMAAVLVAGHVLAPLAVMLCSGTGLFSGLKAIDCLIDRPWEKVRLTYQ